MKTKVTTWLKPEAEKPPIPLELDLVDWNGERTGQVGPWKVGWRFLSCLSTTALVLISFCAALPYGFEQGKTSNGHVYYIE